MKPVMHKPELEQIVREAVARHLHGERVSTGETSPATAAAAVLVAKGRLELRSFPIRAIGDDEILLRVEACGICGTDIHCYTNDPFGLCPVVLGHEGTGQVVAIGKNVIADSVGHHVKVGDQLVTSIMEVGDNCLIAKYNPAKANLCDDLKIYGLLPDEPDNHLNGYFAEYMIVRTGSTFFVANDLPADLRCLIEPAVVCVHALERARRATSLISFRSRVIVQGCGPIGLLMVAAVRAAGVNNIIAIDANEDRLAMAKRLGADHALNVKAIGGIGPLSQVVGDLTQGLGAHFAFQCTGVPAAARDLFRLVRRGGGICEVGHFVDAGECSINPHHDLCRKEITLVGSWVYNSFEYPNAYHFLQRALAIGLPVRELVTHRFPLDRIEEAFQMAMSGRGIKVLVEARRGTD